MTDPAAAVERAQNALTEPHSIGGRGSSLERRLARDVLVLAAALTEAQEKVKLWEGRAMNAERRKWQIEQRAERLQAQLAAIRAVVDVQAEDEGLWGIYPFGEQPIVEAYLQQELRRLHRVIESALAATEETQPDA